MRFVLVLVLLFFCQSVSAAYTHKCLTQGELLDTADYNANIDYESDRNKPAQEIRKRRAVERAMNALSVAGWELFSVDNGTYCFRNWQG